MEKNLGRTIDQGDFGRQPMSGVSSLINIRAICRKKVQYSKIGLMSGNLIDWHTH